MPNLEWENNTHSNYTGFAVKDEIVQVQSLLSSNPPEPEKALKILKKAQRRNTSINWVVFYFQGIAYMQLENFERAIEYLNTAKKKGGNGIEVLQLLSDAHTKLSEFDKAEVFLKQIVKSKEDYAPTWKKLGIVYKAQERYDEALVALMKANNFDKSDLSIAILVGEIYFEMGDYKEAMNAYESVLKVNHFYVDALLGKASVFGKIGRSKEGKDILQIILQDYPTHRVAKRLYGELSAELGDFEAALQVFEELLNNFPDPETRIAYSKSIAELGFYDEAEEQFLRVLKEGSNQKIIPHYLDTVLHNPIHDWEHIQEIYGKILDEYPSKKSDFNLLSNHDESTDRKLNIGFISNTLHDHPDGWKMKALLEFLPKDNFDYYCYNTAFAGKDHVSEQISKHCARYTFLSTASHEAISDYIKFDGIDILINLTPGYEEKIQKVLVSRPAPLILTWSDTFFNPIEFSAVDFLLAKAGELKSFSNGMLAQKRLIFPEVSNLFVPPLRNIESGVSPMGQMGVTTFGCFSDPKKMNYQVLRCWAEILMRAPDSRLLLVSKKFNSPIIHDNIKGQLAEFGIPENRIIIDAPPTHYEQLKRYQNTDIVLDTFPVSDGQMVTEAIWMGIPTVTISGEFLAGVGAKQLDMLGLEGFITDSDAAYINKAIELSKNPERLANLRTSLRTRMEESPFLDEQRFAAHFSKGLRLVWSQYVNQSKQGNRSEAWQTDIEIKSLSEDEYPSTSSLQVEHSSEIEQNAESTKIFTKEFWDRYPNREKSERIVEVTNKFFTGEIGESVLAQIVDECSERMVSAPTDNIAFFIQSRALQAIEPEILVFTDYSNELDQALKAKNWWHKRTIYSYWFEKMERKKESCNPQVSAIVIANKFKEKSVQNLKRLQKQLEGIGEIVFVNNGLEDSEFAPLMPFITTYVKANGNSGAYLARNLGTVFAKGKYLVFVDDDGIPDDDFIESHLKEHSQRDIVVSRGVYYSNDVVGDPWHYNIGTEIKPAYTILEGNAFYNAEAFYSTGGWGDYILFGHGGKDLSYRLLELYPDKEKQIFIPGSRLNHEYFRGDSHKSEKKIKQQISLKLLEALHPGLTETMDTWPTTFSIVGSKEKTKKEIRSLPSEINGSEEVFFHFCRNHVYAQVLSDLMEEVNTRTDQKHILIIEQTPWSAGNGYSIDASGNAHTFFFDSLNKADLNTIIQTSLKNKVNAVFFHGIFRPWEFYLLDKLGTKKHIGWVIWGGDLYHPIQNGIPNHFKVDKIDSIHTLGDGDIDLFLKNFGPREVIKFGYPYPGLYGNISPAVLSEINPRIIVGNSGDASNQHIEILEMLEKKTDISDYEILLPVAYNFKPDYEARVKARIQNSMLRDQISLLKDFQSPSQYFKVISNSHMVITSHHRQQAVGNMLMGLYSGVHTILRDRITVNGKEISNPSWEFFQENDFNVTSYQSLFEAVSISELGTVSEEARTKHQNIIIQKFGLSAKADELIAACESIKELKTEMVA